MTHDQWKRIVEYVLGRLKSEPSFQIKAQTFTEKFQLKPNFELEILMRRDFPAPRLFRLLTIPESDANPFVRFEFKKETPRP